MCGLCVALIILAQLFLRLHFYQNFPNNNKEWEEGIPPVWGESEILLGEGGIFLLGSRNLRRSDFDQSNLFQS